MQFPADLQNRLEKPLWKATTWVNLPHLQTMIKLVHLKPFRTCSTHRSPTPFQKCSTNRPPTFSKMFIPKLLPMGHLHLHTFEYIFNSLNDHNCNKVFMIDTSFFIGEAALRYRVVNEKKRYSMERAGRIFHLPIKISAQITLHPIPVSDPDYRSIPPSLATGRGDARGGEGHPTPIDR